MKRFHKGLIWSFGVLYALVAFISFYHCVAFCLVGNPLWIAVMMSFAFEVGLALTLFSILTTENKNTVIPWILMGFLTLVQVVGNVYSVYKYMVESATNFYTYINDSMLHWFVDSVSNKDIMSIIAIVLGALLPIVALMMTNMVANNIKLLYGRKKEENEPHNIVPEENTVVPPGNMEEEFGIDDAPIADKPEPEQPSEKKNLVDEADVQSPEMGDVPSEEDGDGEQLYGAPMEGMDDEFSANVEAEQKEIAENPIEDDGEYVIGENGNGITKEKHEPMVSFG